MKTLLILRHAKSSWKNPNQADHDRPLNKRGTGDAPQVGKLLIEEGIVPDTILCSTAVRAHDTAELVAQNCGYQREIQYIAEFYHAAPQTYIEALSQLPGEYETAMVIGHNPGLEILLANLTGEYESLPTAALAAVMLEIEDWVELSTTTVSNAVLKNLWRPRELF